MKRYIDKKQYKKNMATEIKAILDDIILKVIHQSELLASNTSNTVREPTVASR